MKRIIVLGHLAAILVLGSLLLPSSVPGRSADERLEHGLPIPFIRQKSLTGRWVLGRGRIRDLLWHPRSTRLRCRRQRCSPIS